MNMLIVAFGLILFASPEAFHFGPFKPSAGLVEFRPRHQVVDELRRLAMRGRLFMCGGRVKVKDPRAVSIKRTWSRPKIVPRRGASFKGQLDMFKDRPREKVGGITLSGELSIDGMRGPVMPRRLPFIAAMLLLALGLYLVVGAWSAFIPFFLMSMPTPYDSWSGGYSIVNGRDSRSDTSYMYGRVLASTNWRISSEFTSRMDGSDVTLQATAGAMTITVASGGQFFAGQGILISDATPQKEPCNIASIAGNVLTIETSLINTYLMANNPTVRGRGTFGIQEAINSIPKGPGNLTTDAGVGGRVCIPTGQYDLYDGIFVDPGRYVQLIGTGSYSTELRLRAGVNQHVIWIGRAGSIVKNRIWLRDFSINGLKGAQVGIWDGVRIDSDTHGCNIESLKIMDCTGCALRINSGRDMVIFNNEIEQCGQCGLEMQGVAYYIFIKNNYFHANTGVGVSMNLAAHGIVFNDNIVALNGDHGISVTTSRWIQINDNHIYANSLVAGSGVRQGLYLAAGDATINDNIFEWSNDLGVGCKHSYDIYLGATVNAVVNGNILKGWSTGPIMAPTVGTLQIGHNMTS